MTAPTTRETADLTSLHKVQTSADHIGEANEKVADHVGDATTMIDHAELISRLEAAEAGSRELDAAIADELDPIPNQHDGYPGRWPFAEGSPLSLRTPAVTTSLDAALALAERVLPGWVYQIDVQSDLSWVLAAPDWWAPALAQGPEARGGQSSVAKTPALALCIAILKAKAEGNG